MSTDQEQPRSGLPPEIVARPELLGGYMTHDRAGRKMPHTMTFLHLIASCAPSQWRDIPGEFWSVGMNDEGYSAGVVSCPCGHMPSVEVLTAARCGGEGCQRVYAFSGREMLVAYMDGQDPAVAAAQAPAA